MKRTILLLLALGLAGAATAGPAEAGLDWKRWLREWRQEHPAPRWPAQLRLSAEDREVAHDAWIARAWKANQAAVERCGEPYIASLDTCEESPAPPTASYSGGGYAAPSYSGPINWDAIAACESGGNWAANTGNGFWGGLQFHPGTWSANGGGPFDGSGPFPYSRATQIVVAERVLASQGIGAWPYCGRFG